MALIINKLIFRKSIFSHVFFIVLRWENRAKRIIRVWPSCVTIEVEYTSIRAIVVIATAIEPRARTVGQVRVLQ